MGHKAQKLILHLGLAKTGSSALQRCLAENKNLLMTHFNVLYPGKLDNHALLQALFCESPELIYQIQLLNLPNKIAIKRYVKNLREEFTKEIEAYKPNTIIISSEYFSSMTVNELNLMYVFFSSVASEIVIFSYIRDPWSYAVSYTQEMIRMGKLKREAQFGYAMSNLEIFNKFETAFDTKVIVAPYIGNLEKFNVVEDFFHRFDLDFTAVNKFEMGKYENVNSKMSLQSAIALLQVNKLFPTFDEYDNYIKDDARDWLYDSLLEFKKSNLPIEMSLSSYEQIYTDSEVDLNKIYDRYFDDQLIFKNHYDSLEKKIFNDKLFLDRLTNEQLSDFLLKSMYGISKKAVTNFKRYNDVVIENYFLTAKCKILSGEIEAGRHILNEILNQHPEYIKAKDELSALDG